MKYNALLLMLIRSGVRQLTDWEVKLNRKLYIQQFDQRDEDIFIVTYMKSGTTLLQMVLYQMLTDGRMDFKHLYDVSPWLDYTMSTNTSLKQFPSPRLLKTHASYKDFPPGFKGRVIYGIRNGMDVALSKYYHLKNYFYPDLGWDEYLNGFMKENEHWFKHVSEWLQNKNKYPVHYVYYEDLVINFGDVVKGIASFLGVTLTDEIYERMLERCSFDYMKAHEEKFGEQPDKSKVYNEFIRNGKPFVGKAQFSDEQKRQYQKLYDQYLGSYDLKYDAIKG